MPYLWDDEAWEDYQYWLCQDKKTARKINELLKNISRTGEPGLGKAELLKGSSHGLRNARTDAKNRLVYSVERDVVRVVSCRLHYGDK